jgi:hypothetical protein
VPSLDSGAARSRERERVYGGGEARARRGEGSFVAGDSTWAQTVKRDMAFEFRSDIYIYIYIYILRPSRGTRLSNSGGT